jgi:hypothetical protein
VLSRRPSVHSFQVCETESRAKVFLELFRKTTKALCTSCPITAVGIKPLARAIRDEIMMNPFRLVVLTTAWLLATACQQTHVTSDDLIKARDIEEFNRHAAAVTALGADGIPLLIAVLEKSLESKSDVLSYGKLNSSIFHLHDLASRGTYDVDSVPVLIRVIDEQIAMGDTLSTADTLRLITGLDVGYDARFVSEYTEEDEERRREMIEKWAAWYATHSGDLGLTRFRGLFNVANGAGSTRNKQV